MRDFKAYAQAMLEELTEQYQQMISFQRSMDSECPPEDMVNQDPATLTDIGFLMREIENLSDDLRKQTKKFKERISRDLAKHLVERFKEDQTLEMRVRGQLAIATPEARVIPQIPPRGSDEYYQLCDALGVSGPAKELGLAQLHYKHIQDYLAQCAQEGKPAPTHLLKSIPDPTVVYRKRTKRTND